MNKIIKTLMVFLGLIMLCGCVSGKDDSKKAKVDSYTIDYIGAEGLDEFELIDCRCFNDSICSIGITRASQEDELFDYYYIKNNYSGELVRKIQLITSADIYMENYCELPNGNVLFAYDYYDENEDRFSVALIYDTSGNVVSRNDTALDGMINTSSFINPFSSDGFFLQYGQDILVCDSDFMIRAKGEIPAECKVIASNDNSFFALYKENRLDYIAQIDNVDLTFKEPILCPVSFDRMGVERGNGKYLFLINDNENLYGFNELEGLTTILNFFDCGLATGYGLFAWNFESDEVLRAVSYYNVEFQKPTVELAEFRRRTRDNRKEIIVGCQKKYGRFREEALAFNRESDEYKASIVEYGDYITEENPNGDRDKILLDMTTGKGPDVFILDNPNTVELLKRKKAFLPLDKYIEEDETIDKADYFPNILKIGSYNGKLEVFIPCVSVVTMIMSEEEGRVISNWSIDEFKEFISEDKNGHGTLYGASRRDVLNLLVYSSETILHDNKCDFMSSDFYDALEIASKYPRRDTPLPYDVDKEIDLFRREECKLEYADISWAGGYGYYKDIIFGEPVSLIGLPGTESGQNLIRYDEAYAISAKSNNKEGAWQFVRRFMKPDYLSGENGEFASHKSLFIESAKNVEMPVWYLRDGGELRARPLSSEEINRLFDFVLSAEDVMYEDPEIEMILDEETAAFFEGQKTAEEVAKIIQSRVSIYIKEYR